MTKSVMVIASVFLLAVCSDAACIAFDHAPEHIGEKTCVTGTVLKVKETQGGTFFLDFCEKYYSCPFTVVVFPSSLRDVGDVRLLEGKTIEIHGSIKHWGGRAEIVLKDIRQLRGEAANIPPMPKTYDADRRGSFSAGEFKKGKSQSRKPPKDKSTLPGTLGPED